MREIPSEWRQQINEASCWHGVSTGEGAHWVCDWPKMNEKEVHRLSVLGGLGEDWDIPGACIG